VNTLDGPMTANGVQTERWDTAQGSTRGAGSTQVTTTFGSHTMSWTNEAGGKEWVITAAEIKAGASVIDLNSPDGIAVDGSRVYVGDRLNDRIVVFDTVGNFIFTFNDGGNLNNPEGVDVDGNGNIYVADRGDQEIVVFDSTGTKIRTIGSGPGAGDGQFNQPEDVAVQTWDKSPASIVGLAAANNLITSTLDSTFGATVTQTSAFIYWPVSVLDRNSILDQGELAMIVIAFSTIDRPSSSDIVKTELSVVNGATFAVESEIPFVVYGVSDLG